MRETVIGICMKHNRRKGLYVPSEYITMIKDAGAVPIVIAPVIDENGSNKYIKSVLDFIILCNEKTRKTLVYEMVVNNRIVEV